MVETEILEERHLFQSSVHKPHGLRLDDAEAQVGDVVLVEVERLGRLRLIVRAA